MDSKQLIKKLIQNFQTSTGSAGKNGGTAVKPIAEIEDYFKGGQPHGRPQETGSGSTLARDDP